MNARLVLERSVLILSIFVLAGTNRCREDYFFATQSNIAITGTGTVTVTTTATTTATANSTGTATLTPTSASTIVLSPTPIATVSITPTVSGTQTTSAFEYRNGTSSGQPGVKPAGLIAELAELDKPEDPQATSTAAAPQMQANADTKPNSNNNWLGGLYADGSADKKNEEEIDPQNLSGPDSDGDGYSDKLEDFERSDSRDPTSIPDWSKHSSLSDRIKNIDDDADGVSNSEEKAQGTDPFKADSDGDGVTDGAEKLSGSNPLSAQSLPLDTDGDGLSDDYEKSLGSNPYSADSDGDGASDSVESAFGSNPVTKDSDLDGISDGREIRSGGDPLRTDRR